MTQAFRVPAVALLAALLPAAEVVDAAPAAPTSIATEHDAAAVAEEAPKQPKNEFVVIPTPSVNPTFGAMLTVMGMYAYRPDPTQAKPWTAGLGGFAAQNGSWGAFGFNRAILAEDTWRVMAGAGYIDLRYDYYGVGGDSPLADDPIELRQRVAMAGGKVLRRFADGLYLGPVVALRGICTSAVDGPIDDLAIDESTAGVGLAGEYDTRDQDFKPGSGWYAQAQWIEQFASDVTLGPVESDGPRYSTAKLALNRYQPLAEGTTLALRAATLYASSDTPFYDLPTLGGRSRDLRGYSGEYRDRVQAATQAEIRQDLPYRFGVVGFAGVGAVEPSYADLRGASLHPSLGGGLRYLIATENRINAALDVAWGDQGWTWYLSAGESF